MKKIFCLAAVAATFFLASCRTEKLSKPEESNNDAVWESPVFTASIDSQTKTAVNVSDGKVSWELADEVTITDAAGTSAVYGIESINPETGSAKFVIKAGEPALGDGPYTAVYGTEPSVSQTYSKTAGRLYMTGEETSAYTLTFNVKCGLLRLNLTQAGVDIANIEVSGTPAGGTQTTYTLDCPQSVNISSAEDFFIALPEGSYTQIVIYDSDGSTCTKTVKSTPLAITTNHIKPVTFTSLKFEYKTLTYFLYSSIEDGAVQW